MKQKKKIVLKDTKNEYKTLDEELIEDKQDGIKTIDYYKRRQRTIKEKVKEWYLRKYKKGHIIMINMELSSGNHRTFIVTENKEGFKYRQKKYLFDNQSKYYNSDFGYYAYDFHEELSLPIKRIVPINDIRTSLETLDVTEVEYAINPTTLERFETSKIAEGIMKGQKLDDFMKKVLVLLVIIVVVTLLHAILFMQKAGIFAQIKMPF